MIEFQLSKKLSMIPEDICDEIFDVSHWPEFKGYGPLPGIATARRSNYSEARIGTRFEVTNRDGSCHVETVIEYVPGKKLVLRFDEFSKPLAFFASHFIETYRFDRVRNATNVDRSFQLFPRNIAGRMLLSIVSIFLKKAVRNHLEQLAPLEKRGL